MRCTFASCINTTSLKQRKRYKNNKKYKLKNTQTMKKNTMEYTAPEMEIVLAMVENGFLGSEFTYGDYGEAGYSGDEQVDNFGDF